MWEGSLVLVGLPGLVASDPCLLGSDPFAPTTAVRLTCWTSTALLSANAQNLILIAQPWL